MEAPKLDFGASKAGFEQDFHVFVESFLHEILLKRLNMPKMPKMLKNAKNAKKANHLQGAMPRVRPRRLILLPWAGQEKVGGGGPPRGVTIK